MHKFPTKIMLCLKKLSSSSIPIHNVCNRYCVFAVCLGHDSVREKKKSHVLCLSRIPFFQLKMRQYNKAYENIIRKREDKSAINGDY